MKHLVYKKINNLKEHLVNGNESQVDFLLCELQNNNLMPAAKDYIEALCKRFSYPISRVLIEQDKIVFPENEPCKLSDFDTRATKQGISIVSCCMNRNDNLLKGLNTWLKLPVDEIIIIDWSSETPVSVTLKDIVDPRIKIVRVEEENNWILTYGFNIGLRMAS